MDVAGAVAVVTGGATGIGRATIERLEAEGARCVSWDLRGDGISCDVTDEAEVERAMAETLAGYGVPTILVASAGICVLGRITEIPIEEWDRSYAVNVRGVFLSVRAVAAELERVSAPGSVTVVSSVNATIADPAHATYSSTKAAIAHLARCAAAELGPNGIRVNAICPGPTATPMMGPLLDDESYAELIAATTPMGRLGQPEDIADGIVNVIRSDWITGQVIGVDGGSMLMTARGAERARRDFDPS